MLGNTYAGQDCSIAGTLEVVGERWTLLVVRDALYGVQRFSDFAEHLDIPRAVLADRLRKLVEHGVLARVGPEGDTSRSAVGYELTEKGRDLWPVVHALAQWGRQHVSAGGPPRSFAHVTCETPLDPDGRCPTCQVTPPVEDVITMRPNVARRRADRVSTVLADPHRMLEPI